MRPHVESSAVKQNKNTVNGEREEAMGGARHYLDFAVGSFSYGVVERVGYEGE